MMHQRVTYKQPRVLDIYEMFENRLEDEFVDDNLTWAACMATAAYLFDPDHEDELDMYATFIMYRIEDWYAEELI